MRISAPLAALAIPAIALAILCTAWWFEFVLGYVPCDLCLLQRWPYYVAIGLGLAAALALVSDVLRKYAPYLLFALAVTFTVSMAFGIFHAGVEWGWWPGLPSCSGGGALDTSLGLGDLSQALNAERIVPCDRANWRMFGLSFAGYNAIASLILSVFAWIKFRHAKNET